MRFSHFFILCLGLPASCYHVSDEPYQNYQITHDEAVPACNMRGAIYRNRR